MSGSDACYQNLLKLEPKIDDNVFKRSDVHYMMIKQVDDKTRTSFMIACLYPCEVSCMKKVWNEDCIHGNEIAMHENEISMHENDISMSENQISMHKNEISMHEN